MAQIESTGGTRTFVSTPHVYDLAGAEKTEEYTERVALLNEQIQTANIPATVLQGAEVFPGMSMLDAFEQGRPLTLGLTGRYMLVDIPLHSLPNDFEAFLFGLLVRGVTPIIAHPERSGPIQAELERLEEYRERGVLLQINAGSLSGRYGPGAIDAGTKILERGWADLVASDSHRPAKAPVLGTFVERWQKRFGNDYVEYLTQIAPKAIVAGDPLPPKPSPVAPPPEGFFSRLTKRFRRDG